MKIPILSLVVNFGRKGESYSEKKPLVVSFLPDTRKSYRECSAQTLPRLWLQHASTSPIDTFVSSF